jgi:hypothetical protein
LAIVLSVRDPETRNAVALDCALPGKEFLNGKGIPGTGVGKSDDPGLHRGNDGRFAPADPTDGVARGEVGEGDGAGKNHLIAK